ncbi:MAG: hypothetical protein AAF202_02125, partial [Pseudomonadota bacterium]
MKGSELLKKSAVFVLFSGLCIGLALVLVNFWHPKLTPEASEMLNRELPKAEKLETDGYKYALGFGSSDKEHPLLAGGRIHQKIGTESETYEEYRLSVRKGLRR